MLVIRFMHGTQSADHKLKIFYAGQNSSVDKAPVFHIGWVKF